MDGTGSGLRPMVGSVISDVLLGSFATQFASEESVIDHRVILFSVQVL
jgi:hypothetical protein